MRPALPGFVLAAALVAARAACFPVSFGGMSCDLPEGWTVLSSEEGSFAAVDGPLVAGTAVLQVSWLPATAYGSAVAMVEAVGERLAADGEVSEFPFGGGTAALADVAFSAGAIAVKGWLLCIDGERNDVAVLGYADAASYEAQADFIVSAMDSFSLDAARPAGPGPMSQFLSPYPRTVPLKQVAFAGSRVPVRSGAEELDAMQAVIEREARILVAYAKDPARDEAWKRSYRVIYRDSRPRLEETALEIGRIAGGEGVDAAETAAAVLGWLQGFGYVRTGSLSDLLSPLAAVGTRSGDCDARALAYVIILSHLGIDGVILVSSHYRHAVAAVEVDAGGVGFVLDGRRYLTAETTKSAPLGWIDEQQRDLSKWVIVELR